MALPNHPGVHGDERCALRRRFRKASHTPRVIGNEPDLTRERTRQIEGAGLRRRREDGTRRPWVLATIEGLHINERF